MSQIREKLLASLFLISFFALMTACVSGSSSTPSADEGQNAAAPDAAPGVEKIELASLEDMETGEVLNGSYDNIVIRDFESSAQIQADYPNAAGNCKSAIIKQLQGKKVFKTVEEDRKDLPGKSAVVDLKIVDMRITSGAARFWGGVFVGSSFMEVLVEVRDGGSDEVVHQKVLATSNNAWAASYTGGSSDQSLPSDFGTLVGEYLFRVIPAK